MYRPALQAARLFARSTRTNMVLPALGRVRFESSTPSTPNTKSTSTSGPAEPLEWKAPVVSYEVLKPRTQSPKPNTYLIDVREPDEVAQGMIPSAVNVPLTVLEKAIRMDDAAFEQNFGFKKPGLTQQVTFYCRSGKRSATASGLAMRAGFKNVYNYKGSWLEWVEKEVDSAKAGPAA